MQSPSGQRAPARSRPPSGRPRPFGRLPRTRRRGQALVEFALVVPIMMLILLITVDFARVFFTYIQVNNAAREGAAYGAANPTNTATITSRALQEIDAQAQRGEHPPVVTATCADALGNTLACASAPGGAGTGNTITVGVAERFDFLTPLINGVFGNAFQVGGAATAAVINLAASGSGGPGTCTVAPNASFTFSVSGLGVTLDASGSTPDSGLCAISGYNWSLGDPANPDPFPPVTGVAASYTYSTAGTYTITLEVTNQAGNSTTTRTVTIGTGPTPTPTPTPAATPTPTPAPTPSPTPIVCTMTAGISATLGSNYVVTFTGSYTGQPAPVTWSWSFPGGSPASSNLQAPGTVQYPSKNGKKYDVTLTITNGPCSDTQTITVHPKA